MAESDVGPTAAYSGHALKNAVPGFSSGHNTSTPRGVRTDSKSTALWNGTDSSTKSIGTHDDDLEHAEGVSIPQNASAHQLSAPPHEGVATGVTGFHGR